LAYGIIIVCEEYLAFVYSVVGTWVAQYNDKRTRLRAGESGVRFPEGKIIFVFSMMSRQPPTQ